MKKKWKVLIVVAAVVLAGFAVYYHLLSEGDAAQTVEVILSLLFFL